MNLHVQYGSIVFSNPVLMASGTLAYGQEIAKLYNLSELGAVISKTITREPRAGNPAPRIVETASGMLNSIGLANPGMSKFISQYLSILRDTGARVIVNIAGECIDDYVLLCKRLNEEEGICAIELNLSCPNVSGGLEFGRNPVSTRRLVAKCRKTSTLPVIAKLSPNITDITESAQAAEDGGADGLSMINTVVGMAVETSTQSAVLKRNTGGLSGPAIKPIALAMVWKTSQVVEIPIIGIGGITSGLDVIEFLLAGATAVQIGTANFLDPWSGPRIIDEIRKYCIQNEIRDVQALTGQLRTNGYV